MLSEGRGSTSISLPPLVAEGENKYREELRVRSDDEIVAVQVDIQFDSNKITINSVAKGGAAASHQLSQRQISPGVLRAVLISPTNKTFGDGALLDITFECSTALTAEDRVFSLTNLEFSTRSAFAVTASLAPYVEITAPTTSTAPVGETLAITAISVATEGEVDRVEFFAGDLKIGVATAEPYSVNYFPTTLGPALITAVAVTDLDGRGTDEVAVEFTGDPSFERWRNANFTAEQRADDAISSPTADPDGDKIPNLMEYSLGLDPQRAHGMGTRMESAPSSLKVTPTSL